MSIKIGLQRAMGVVISDSHAIISVRLLEVEPEDICTNLDIVTSIVDQISGRLFSVTAKLHIGDPGNPRPIIDLHWPEIVRPIGIRCPAPNNPTFGFQQAHNENTGDVLDDCSMQNTCDSYLADNEDTATHHHMQKHLKSRVVGCPVRSLALSQIGYC